MSVATVFRPPTWAGMHHRFGPAPRQAALYAGAGDDTRFLRTQYLAGVTRFTCVTPRGQPGFARRLDAAMEDALLPLDKASSRWRVYGTELGRQVRHALDCRLPDDTWKLASQQYHHLIVGAHDPPAATTLLLHGGASLVLYPEAPFRDDGGPGLCAALAGGRLPPGTFAQYAVVTEALRARVFTDWDDAADLLCVMNV